MGNCCGTSLSEKRQPVFLVDVGTGELSTVRAPSQGTAFTYSSELNPFVYVHGQLKYKTVYKTAASSASKAGPLLVFPIENVPTGSKPWKHPADTKNTIKALFNHILFHGGEQVLFTSWLDIMEAEKKSSTLVAVLTSLGRMFLLSGSKIKDTFHIGDIHTVALDAPGEVRLLLAPVHSGTREAKLPKSYHLSTSPQAADCLCQALRALSRVLYANAPQNVERPLFHGSIQELPLPSLSQDGGFHSAYCMWHNLHSSKIYGSLRDRAEGRAPQVELVTACAGGDWSGPTAIVATRMALKRLELDITGWDATATEAAAWALRYNNIFKSIRVGPRSTPAAALLAPILSCNTVLLKFHMEAVGSTFAGPEAMSTLGSALARNPQPGFAEITIAGNKLSGDAATAWAGGFGNLRAGQLVVTNLSACSMDESGSAAVLLSLESQAQSLSTIILSGNRLGERGTRSLNKLLRNDAVSLQTLELENCQANLESLGTSILSCVGSLKSLTSLSVSGNKWSPAISMAAKELKNLKILKATNTSIQSDAIQELLSALSGCAIGLDLSFNQSIKAPNGLAKTLKSRIGVRSIKARECELGDEGTSEILSAVGDCPIVKVLDLGCNLTSNPGLDAFNQWLTIEVSSEGFLHAVTNAGSLDAAMAVYFLAAERSSLQATNNQRTDVEGSPERMQTAISLTQALLPQGSGQALEELAIPGRKDERGHFLFGPLLTLPIQLALHINTSLTKLDISYNGMGDAGAIFLGRALRQNRTLTSLKLDGNGVELEGLKAIRGCLYGNKKLVELPFLDDDMGVILENLGNQYIASLQQEVQARIEIGQAYKVYGGGRVHRPMQQAAMAKLKNAKQVQSRTQQTKNKLRTTAAQVQGDILRNQIVAEIKTAKVLAKAEDKAALNALKRSSKAGERLNKMEERNKKKAWEDRYKLLHQWKRTAEGAQSDKRANHDWWNRWLNEWGRPYLTPDGLASLWASVPQGERERYQSNFNYSRDVFEGHKELSDQIRELRLLKQTGEADGTYHAKEAEYYNFVASKDPAQVQSNPPHPGIEHGRKPGDLGHDFRGYGGRVDWAARRSAIIGDINNTIRSGPPKDFKWTPPPNPNNPPKPITSPSAATGASAPMLAFGMPVTQVTGTPAGGGAAAAQAIGSGGTQGAPHPISVPPPASYDPNYIPTPTANQSSATLQPTTAPPPGYPGGGAGGAATSPYVPPPAPEPYQAAAAAPGGAQGYHFYNSYLEDHDRFQNRPPEYQNYYYGPGRYGGAYDPYDNDDDYYYDRHGRRRRRYSDDGFGGSSILPFLLLTSAMYSPFFSPWYGGFWGYGFGGFWGWGGGFNTYNHTEINNYNINQEINQGTDELGDAPPQDVAETQEAAGEGGAGGADIGGDGGQDDGGDGGDDGMGEADGMDMYGGAGPTDLPDGGGGGDGKAGGIRGGLRACWEEEAWEAERVRLWFERRWATILSAADDAVLGPTRLLRFPRQAMALPSKKAYIWQSRCTLVTQASLDRKQRILEQANAWGGRISLALYIDAPRGSAASGALLEEVKELHSMLEAGPAAVDISLLWAMPEAHNDYDRMYPVNALRNLALSAAATELVFLLDVDFQPSKGLLEAAEGRAPQWNATASAVKAVAKAAVGGERVMLVVPAFEVALPLSNEAAHHSRRHNHDYPAMPRYKRQLASMLKTGTATGFHVGHFPQGHSPTDYPRWVESRTPYAVPFSEYFEPYVIAARSLVPPYDERFRGYGMNKISHLYAAAATGFSFVVAPEVFVAAFEHEKSDSWRATFGDTARAEQKVRISALYRRFKQELRCLPGLVDSLQARATDVCAEPDKGAAPSHPAAPSELGKRSISPVSLASRCKQHRLEPAAAQCPMF